MKSIEQLIFEKRFKDEEFDANDFNDWAKENEGEAYKLCLEIAKEMQKDSGGFDEGYSKGYGDAQREASQEIREHYHPNM